MIAPVRIAVAAAAAFAAIATFGGCESIYGIGDLPHGPAAGDGGLGSDSGSSSGSDSGSGSGSCTPVTIPALPAGAAACPASGGACSPASVAGLPAKWVPPVERTGACSTRQLDDYFSLCVDATTGSAEDCDAWAGDSANTVCRQCLIVPQSASAYGAAFTIAGTTNFQINVAGCVALAEPCNLPCAKAALAQVLCALASCDATKNCSGTTQNELVTCLNAATEEEPSATAPCACQGYKDVVTTCDNGLTGASRAKCTGSSTLETYRNVAAFMCGPL